MNLACISSLLSLLVIAPAFAADHLEIRTRLHGTWEAQTTTNEHETTVICVVGTNDWYISGQFLKNASVEYWLTGTEVLERKVITSSMYLEQAKELISEKLGTKRPRPFLGRYPAKGETSTRVRSWLEPFGYGVERVVWLAFCSGTFLRTADRQVPLPLGPSSQARGFADKTVFHDEDKFHVSPPKSVVLFTTNEAMVCKYEVVASTNVFGRIFPIEFRLLQYGVSRSRTITGSRTTLIGKVESMKLCEAPPASDAKSSRD